MKQIFVVCLCIVLLVLGGCDTKEKPTPSINIVELTPIPTREVITELPPIEKIGPVESPLLYDFVCGCLDWHVSIHRDVLDSDLYILRHTSSPEILYTDWYIMQSGYTTPPQGSKVERVTLKPRELDAFDSALTNISDEYKVRDGEWELIIYAGEAARVLNDTQITFRIRHGYAEGRVPPFITDGSGWPTDWLRQEPYLTRLRETSDIDMTDVWWDTFALEGKYELVPVGIDEGTVKYYALCTGVREFSFCDDQGNVARGMSWDSLRETCNALQMDIPGIYVHGTWEQVAHE